jgi:hypothetical protein
MALPELCIAKRKLRQLVVGHAAVLNPFLWHVRDIGKQRPY